MHSFHTSHNSKNNIPSSLCNLLLLSRSRSIYPIERTVHEHAEDRIVLRFCVPQKYLGNWNAKTARNHQDPPSNKYYPRLSRINESFSLLGHSFSLFLSFQSFLPFFRNAESLNKPPNLSNNVILKNNVTLRINADIYHQSRSCLFILITIHNPSH